MIMDIGKSIQKQNTTKHKCEANTQHLNVEISKLSAQ